ncbi:MAG: hypothetical protein M3Y37_11100 [Chloroflexota bacterium]|nr:hypothetical protein [Chloroflexota bacterium]
MYAFVFDPVADDPSVAQDAILIADARVDGKRRFRKGSRIGPEDLTDLARIEGPIHLVKLEPGDVHEDEAGVALANAIAGQGLEIRKPVQSRVNLNAAHKGLLRVDRDAVIALNRLEGVSVFTLMDGVAVLPGKNVAGAKIAPVAIPQPVLDEALAIAARTEVVEVKPFIPRKVAVITTEGLEDAVRERFRASVEAKIAWYGSTITGFIDLLDEPERVANAMRTAIDDGAELILSGGGNSLDPLDPTLRALADMGAEMVKFGAPAHPGSMFWLAYCGEVPIFNLASCSLYSRSTVGDLVLPWIMAGERVETDDIAEIGWGGLLDKDAQFRFPPYDGERE